jgi:hypothetical protein
MLSWSKIREVANFEDGTGPAPPLGSPPFTKFTRKGIPIGLCRARISH